ncbi:MAG: hypothetical protein QM487_01555 [Candidatus Marithrix sp.]
MTLLKKDEFIEVNIYGKMDFKMMTEIRSVQGSKNDDIVPLQVAAQENIIKGNLLAKLYIFTVIYCIWKLATVDFTADSMNY